MSNATPFHVRPGGFLPGLLALFLAFLAFLALVFVNGMLLYPLAIFAMGAEAAREARFTLANLSFVFALTEIVGVVVLANWGGLVFSLFPTTSVAEPLWFPDEWPIDTVEAALWIKKLHNALYMIQRELALSHGWQSNPIFVDALQQAEVALQKLPDYMSWVDFVHARESIERGEVDEARLRLATLLARLRCFEKHPGRP